MNNNIMQRIGAWVRNAVIVLFVITLAVKFFPQIPWPDWITGWMNFKSFPWLNIPIFIGFVVWAGWWFAVNATSSMSLIKMKNSAGDKKVEISKDHPLVSLQKFSGALLALGLYGLWGYICFWCLPFILRMYFNTFTVEFLRMLLSGLFPIVTCALYFPTQQYYPDIYGAKKAITFITIGAIVLTTISWGVSLRSPKLFHYGVSDVWYESAALNNDLIVYRLSFNEPPDGKEYRCDTTGNILTHLTINSPESVKSAIRDKMRWKVRLPYFNFDGGGGQHKFKPVLIQYITMNPGQLKSTTHSFAPGERVLVKVKSGKVAKITGSGKTGDIFTTEWGKTLQEGGVLGFREYTGSHPAEIEVFLYQ
ncbi:hypothetical protein A2331_05280 [Candidatus Falkowbacteria bacterium RIFOXYB2_FULL_34_18]|uniref:Uncharacterized protein n=1 Tax=Candidatus Falkowbacteria bacterium RIFOXYD2_FULL_34_120 TaxID=1798007 RepID=A0A1F5TQL5_9BACT|nr:MAG: hypothetical protein A2331_05280 [Candidatus Falkowbacteria bacterium RIFOXYB2_FULL_34_18]OGF29468.1 MAG: hypothetical protein A2500_04145 [Candidatus Falkowbacteria bacterium RIFOXYC12_FULL_34_55]OGF36285.1 MAG: hypothetical protein A2466_05155 [Candidatus Falkowbacteria bacterium RIFOXYC2_FULL_34_220]OGF38994.1 MAG: hypothetical protein A2515_06610 [Candidatus Falkowbacteria bacterium RIFOXYD12_FULL_34_57]OGF41213.1 MAG: hypothetical protein A2531_00850 [Candidatus Falkowbacteria bact